MATGKKHWAPLWVYSHPRSGTNWLLALLEQAFFGSAPLVDCITGHWSRRVPVTAPGRRLLGGHVFYAAQFYGAQARFRWPRVYLYRDGRDVALSLWRTKDFQHEDWHNLSFSEFLRRPLDWLGDPSQRVEHGMTIAEHWKAHLESWREVSGICLVRYEELLLHTKSEIARIAAFVGREPLPAADNMPGMGPNPSGDYRVAKWRGEFTKDDMDYFFTIVPPDYWGLWNK